MEIKVINKELFLSFVYVTDFKYKVCIKLSDIIAFENTDDMYDRREYVTIISNSTKRYLVAKEDQLKLDDIIKMIDIHNRGIECLS